VTIFAGRDTNATAMDETITIEFDGGSRGNPGPAAVGVVLRAHDGTVLQTLGRPIGKATNNVAEYEALIAGLELAKKLKARKLMIRGDSEVIIKQMTGAYRVRQDHLIPLYDKATALTNGFDNVEFEHNLRHKNELADKLANRAMDLKREVTDADLGDAGDSPLDGPSPRATQAGDRFVCARCGCEIKVEKPSSIRPHQLKPFICQCGNKMRDA
jgi:ribonuclease HI